MSQDAMYEIPAELPASGQDWANYLACFGPGEARIQNVIQVVLEFGNPLDIDRLKTAVRLSVDAEPVLGCCFVEDSVRAYWRRFEQLDTMEWCRVEENTGDQGKALQRVLTMPLQPDSRQLQVHVLRLDGKDILCIKMNHACTDGAGVKEYLRLLSVIYTKLCENPSWVPVPNTSGRRDAGPVFEALGIADPRMAYSPQLAALRPTWAFPYRNGVPETFRFVIRRLDSACLDGILSYARERKATLNDMILTAYYRALFEMQAPVPGEPMEIYVTCDLRRYLPDRKAGTVCNLSGILNARVARVEGEYKMN